MQCVHCVSSNMNGLRAESCHSSNSPRATQTTHRHMIHDTSGSDPTNMEICIISGLMNNLEKEIGAKMKINNVFANNAD